MKATQSGIVGKLLLVLFLTGCVQAMHLNDFADDYWLNGTQFEELENNVTDNSVDYKKISEISEPSDIIPVDPLKRVAFVALFLHILIVAGGIVIYCVACCKSHNDRRRLLAVKRRLQNPPTIPHVPNAQDCPCHGCILAKQILGGLILQNILNERSEQPH